MATFKYDEDDDYGVPKLLVPTRSPAQRLRVAYHRWRNPLLALLGLVLLLYWLRSGERDPTDWSRFAYMQYATDTHTLCNTLLIFDSLKRLGSKADRVLLFPEDWNVDRNDPDRNSQLLYNVRRDYNVRLKPIQIL